jgi:tetratricopeptide (TPR) repeat protein
MLKSVFCSLGLLLSVVIAASVHAQSVDDQLRRANQIDWNRLADPAVVDAHLARYLQIIAKDPKHLEAHIRASEFTFYAWRLESDRSKRLALVRRGLGIATEATKIDPESGAAWYWRGSQIALIGLTQGVLNSLQLIPEGKAALERAAKLDPDYRDGLAMANIARVYTVVPGFPISIGNRVGGKKMLLEGYRRYPNSSYYPLYLADAYWDDGDTEQALKYAREAQSKKSGQDYRAFVNTINARKAKELEQRIIDGVPRDRFNDVLSDHAPAGMLN